MLWAACDGYRGPVLGSFWGHFGVFGIILGVRGLCWSHFAPFSKYTLISNGCLWFYTSLDAGWSYFGVILGHFGVTSGTRRWLWITLGSFWGQFGIPFDGWEGLVGLKSENVDFSLVLKAFFKGQRGSFWSKFGILLTDEGAWWGWKAKMLIFHWF